MLIFLFTFLFQVTIATIICGLLESFNVMSDSVGFIVSVLVALFNFFFVFPYLYVWYNKEEKD